MGPLCRTAADLSLLLSVLLTPHGDRFEQAAWRLELPPAPSTPLNGVEPEEFGVQHLQPPRPTSF